MTRHLHRRFGLLACFLCLLASQGTTQVRSNSQEVWPSVDVYYHFHPHWRLYGTWAGIKDESTYTEGALGLYVDYFAYKIASIRRGHADDLPGKFLWIRAGYQFSGSPPNSEDDFRENMLVTEANARVYMPYTILLTIKNRFDARFSEGDFKLRYRPRLTLEKDMRTKYLSFTTNAMLEYYANFGSSSVNRFRSQIGVELRVLDKVNYEIYWSHQFSNEPEITAVDAFGMSLKFYLEGKGKTKSEQKPAQ